MQPVLGFQLKFPNKTTGTTYLWPFSQINALSITVCENKRMLAKNSNLHHKMSYYTYPKTDSLTSSMEERWPNYK